MRASNGSTSSCSGGLCVIAAVGDLQELQDLAARRLPVLGRRQRDAQEQRGWDRPGPPGTTPRRASTTAPPPSRGRARRGRARARPRRRRRPGSAYVRMHARVAPHVSAAAALFAPMKIQIDAAVVDALRRHRPRRAARRLVVRDDHRTRRLLQALEELRALLSRAGSSETPSSVVSTTASVMAVRLRSDARRHASADGVGMAQAPDGRRTSIARPAPPPTIGAQSATRVGDAPTRRASTGGRRQRYNSACCRCTSSRRRPSAPSC